MLRQEWATLEVWPWLLLLGVMFAGAFALHGLRAWLPGELIQPRAVVMPARRRRIIGVVFIVISLALTGGIVALLMPDYFQWQGAQYLWLAALGFMVAGAWLVGAVGEISSRAATGITLWRETRRSRLLEAIVFVLILLLAIFLRVYRLDSIPPGIYVDETNGALDALRIMEGGGASPFGTGWYETPNGYLYYMAAIFNSLGANWTSLKIASLLPAILTIPALYLLGRLMFGPTAGLFAMLMLTVSRWHMTTSRWGWNETAPPLFQVLAFFFLVRGLRDRRALDYTLSGLLMSLAVYTYLSSRLAAATLILYVVYWFVSDPDGIRVALRRSWLGIIVLGVAATVAVAPLMVTYISNPFILNNRVNEISVFREMSDEGSISPLLRNIGDVLRFFHQTGDLQGKHNLPGEPMADPFTGLLFAFGAAYSLLAWRDHRRVMLIFWLVIGLAGSYLSSTHESPQSYRSFTALPAVILLAADILDRIVRALYRVLREWRVTAARPRLAVVASGGFAAIMLAGAGIWETSIYFGPQASSIEIIRGFNATENDVAKETIAALEAGKSVYLSPNYSSFSPLRFLVYGVIKAQTGENVLDNMPYRVVVPEVNLPLSDDGHDVLMLIDREYWLLRDYIASFYPEATMELMRLPDNDPYYMRVEIPQAQVAALQGLKQTITYADGRQEEQTVPQVELNAPEDDVAEVVWEGAIRLEHGGEYELVGEGGLEVYLDGKALEGFHYLGRGFYGLRVVWRPGMSEEVRLVWRQAEQEPTAVPREALFSITWPQHGLLGAYYDNPDWEGDPVFMQVTPFLQLAWPDEPPIRGSDMFSARYTGMLRITDSGIYTFRIDADDGVRLIINGEVLGEAILPNQPNTIEASIDLEAGEHPIQIDYFQLGGGSALKVFWRQGDDSWIPVPPSAFIPAQPAP